MNHAVLEKLLSNSADRHLNANSEDHVVQSLEQVAKPEMLEPDLILGLLTLCIFSAMSTMKRFLKRNLES